MGLLINKSLILSAKTIKGFRKTVREPRIERLVAYQI